MSLTVRLDALRQRSQQRADQENSTLCSTAEWNQWVNEGYRELYEMLIGWGQEYFLASTSFTTSNGVDTYPLPADFFRLRGVDASVGGETLSIKPFQFDARNRYKLTGTWRRGDLVYYRLRGSLIWFIPAPTSATAVTLWYYPTATVLAADSDTIDGVDGWDDYIVASAAKKAAMKEESLDLAQMLEADRQMLAGRIQANAPQRDAGFPERVQDVSGWSWDE